jgi:hypothetical protein
MIGCVINDSKLVLTKQVQIHGNFLVQFNMIWSRLLLNKQEKGELLIHLSFITYLLYITNDYVFFLNSHVLPNYGLF